MSEMLFGKPCVEDICTKINRKVFAYGNASKLYTIGFDEPRWQQYATSIGKSASKYGFEAENVILDDSIAPFDMFEGIKAICAKNDCGGVILQQPLPQQYAQAVNYVDVSKDVDCLNPLSVAKLYQGEEGFRPATPSAVLALLDYYGIDLTGKNVVIVGRGSAVGKPLALMMLKRNATVTVCHTKTVDLPSVCRRADILVSACGVADLIKDDFVTTNTVVIDVGLSFVDGVTRGDVSQSVYDKCKAVSPVPGGVGPVTRAMLFANLLNAITK